jgi:hypothetical protein
MEMADSCIATVFVGMDTWFQKGNWKNGFGDIFLDFRTSRQKYYLRLNDQVVRHAIANTIATPIRNITNALHVYLKEPRMADITIPPILQDLDRKAKNVDEYITIDVNDYMEDFTRVQRHRYNLQVQHGLSVFISCYTWIWVGNMA